MNLGLDDKVAMVMGGGSGIGRGVATAIAAEGAKVAIVSRSIKPLEEAANEIAEQTGSEVTAFSGDLSDFASVERAVSRVREQLGSISILVNNGGGPPPSGVSGVDPQLWRQQFEQMVLALIGLTDSVLPDMRALKWGRIMTVVSSGVIEPHSNIGISNTLRSSLVGWSKTLAGEIACDGITSNLLVPGWIQSKRLEQIDAAVAKSLDISVSEAAQKNHDRIPLGRYGTADEFGAVAAFIASEKASYVTGSMIRIDGGAVHSI